LTFTDKVNKKVEEKENGKREVERMRAEGRWRSGKLSERDKDTGKQEKGRIREPRYNREYERCVTEEILVYQGREIAKGRK
jgi:hypothetical protein